MFFAEPVLDIKEGDVFYALATFVSETGEAMNLVEGERVFVLEWNNQVSQKWFPKIRRIGSERQNHLEKFIILILFNFFYNPA